ncbi:MAG: hypothetical protein H6736_20230 [Alphaproteobacteria bacterium]|nr:hypothetical protein [Alphaproteobacteria bacterium]
MRGGHLADRWQQDLGADAPAATSGLSVSVPVGLYPEVVERGYFVPVYLKLEGVDLQGRVRQRHQLPSMYYGVDPRTGQHVLWSKDTLLANTTHGTTAPLSAGQLAALADTPNTIVRPWIPGRVQRAPDELEGMDPRDRVIATDVEVE